MNLIPMLTLTTNLTKEEKKMRKTAASILIAMFMAAGTALAQDSSQSGTNQMKPMMAKEDSSMMKNKKGMKMSSMKSMKMKKSPKSMMMKDSSGTMKMKSSSNRMMMKKPMKSSKKDTTMMNENMQMQKE